LNHLLERNAVVKVDAEVLRSTNLPFLPCVLFGGVTRVALQSSQPFQRFIDADNAATTHGRFTIHGRENPADEEEFNRREMSSSSGADEIEPKYRSAISAI
jgi:hypothetical protein